MYTVQVTLKVDADSEHQAYDLVHLAIPPTAGVQYVDAEVIETQPDSEDGQTDQEATG
jgi:hypothetical protein